MADPGLLDWGVDPAVGTKGMEAKRIGLGGQ
jgi:hypothetical protein